MATNCWSWRSSCHDRCCFVFLACENTENCNRAKADVSRSRELAVFVRRLLGTVQPHQTNNCCVGEGNAALLLQRMPHKVARFASIATRPAKQGCSVRHAGVDRWKSRDFYAGWFSTIPTFFFSAQRRRFGERLPWRHGASHCSASRARVRGGALCVTQHSWRRLAARLNSHVRQQNRRIATRDAAQKHRSRDHCAVAGTHHTTCNMSAQHALSHSGQAQGSIRETDSRDGVTRIDDGIWRGLGDAVVAALGPYVACKASGLPRLGQALAYAACV